MPPTAAVVVVVVGSWASEQPVSVWYTQMLRLRFRDVRHAMSACAVLPERYRAAWLASA